jgi:hypothetical protein
MSAVAGFASIPQRTLNPPVRIFGITAKPQQLSAKKSDVRAMQPVGEVVGLFKQTL